MVELGAITPNITAYTTRRSTSTSGCISTIVEMHDGASTNVDSVAMKMKSAIVRSTNKSTVTQTQLSSRSLMATLQTMAPTTPRAP